MATFVGGVKSDPIRNLRYGVRTLGSSFIPEGSVGFSEVDNLNLGATEIIKYAEGNDLLMRKLPGRTEFDNVTFKRGIDANRVLASWREVVMEALGSSIAHKDISPLTQRIIGDRGIRATIEVSVYDRTSLENTSEEPYQRWLLYGAWPCHYVVGTLNAHGSTEVLVESCEFAVELIQLVVPSRQATGR